MSDAYLPLIDVPAEIMRMRNVKRRKKSIGPAAIQNEIDRLTKLLREQIGTEEWREFTQATIKGLHDRLIMCWLTKAQVAVLRRVKNGDVLVNVGGGLYRWAEGGKEVPYPTAKKINNSGFWENTLDGVKLTAAGKKALAAYEAREKDNAT